jgi:hypothetical protein
VARRSGETPTALFTLLPRTDILGNPHPTSCIDCRAGATIAHSFAPQLGDVSHACNTVGWLCRFRYGARQDMSGYHESNTARRILS